MVFIITSSWIIALDANLPTIHPKWHKGKEIISQTILKEIF